MKMKKAYIYLISFFSLIILFTLCYFFSFKMALNQFNESSIKKNNILLSYETAKNASLEGISTTPNLATTIGQEKSQNTELNEQVISVDTLNEELITPTTKYTLETYDIKTNLMETEDLNAPEYLVGLSRTDVITYVNNYIIDVPLEDFEKGLVSYELISFSPKQVVLRKSYNSDNVQYKYYLAIQAGLLTVYYSDKKTVYEYTDIALEELSEDEQIELIHGKYISDQEELYGILQNYTS